MLTIFSNEVDIEMSDQNSVNCTDYKISNNDDYDDNILTSVNELSSNTKKSTSESFSYYDRRNTISIKTDSKSRSNEIDHFDPNDLRGMYNDIDFTGDKVDSGASNKTEFVSQYAIKQALKLNQLRREIVCHPKSDLKQNRIMNKNVIKSINTNSKKNEFISSTKKNSPTRITGKAQKHNYRISTSKEFSDMDSITLLIRVPRNKLINHIKNKSITETWKSMSTKSSSCESISTNSEEKESDTIQESSDSPDTSSEKMKSDSVSESEITSIIDKSKEILEKSKTSPNKSNKKLQTVFSNTVQSTNQSDKITQTLNSPQETIMNSIKGINNYFLCNICHKIIPANLSPICLKLPCSAIKKCNLIFHGELDMIMHLPVKHTNEFASYHICSKCNRMYHPSNIVTMKGSYTCMDCVTSLAQLTISN